MKLGKTRDENIVIFDGHCNLCNGFVQFVLKHEKEQRFRFTSLQSASGKQLLARHRIDPKKIDSIVCIQGNSVFIKSKAVLQVFRFMKFPWNILRAFQIVPRFIADPIYDFVAGHRYRWFGKRDTCWIPTEKYANRFLDNTTG